MHLCSNSILQNRASKAAINKCLRFIFWWSGNQWFGTRRYGDFWVWVTSHHRVAPAYVEPRCRDRNVDVRSRQLEQLWALGEESEIRGTVRRTKCHTQSAFPERLQHLTRIKHRGLAADRIPRRTVWRMSHHPVCCSRARTNIIQLAAWAAVLLSMEAATGGLKSASAARLELQSHHMLGCGGWKHKSIPTWAYLRALRRPSTLFGGWSLRTLMQPFICRQVTRG